MKLENESFVLNKKLSQKVIVFDILAHIGWFPTAGICAYIGKIADVTLILKALTSISCITAGIIAIITPIIKAKIFFPKFQNLNHENIKSPQYYISLFQKISIIIPLSIGILGPFFVSFEISILKNHQLFLRYIFVSIGNVLLVSTLFAGMMFRRLEKLVRHIIIDEKIKALSMMSRIVLTAGFSFIGTLCIIISVMITSNAEDLKIVLLRRVLPLCYFGLIVSMLNITSLTRTSAKRIKELQENMKFLAKGDYSNEPLVINARDESGILMTDFNTFLNFNKNFISDLNASVNISDQVAEDLSANMNETQASLQHISGNIDSVNNNVQNQTTGILETQATIEQIARNIENLDKNIDTQANSVAESASAVQQMVANIQSVTGILEKNADSFSELQEKTEDAVQATQASANRTQKIAEASESLLEASSVIQHIASQTNLLAMNAAIEAAHAGEAGKGFAVVADEIRKLAEEAGSQGKQISSVLKELQTEIETVATDANHVYNQFHEISKLTNIVKDKELVIMNAMQEQSSGGTQVLEAMNQITDITTEVKEGSAEMLLGNNEVGKEMARLANSAQSVSDSVLEITDSVIQITNTIDEVINLGLKNKDAVSKVLKHLEQLKI